MKRRPHIMVVDEDRRMLKMLKRTLKPNGYGITTATDGSSALTMLEKHRPDLVILDIMMPELDGFWVLDRIRQHSNAPIIMLTARGEAPLSRKVLVTGADDYVQIPFTIPELLAHVKAKLRRTRTGVPN